MGGSQECPNCGACKESVEHVVFECASYDSQRKIMQVLTLEAFETVTHDSIFDKAVFVWVKNKVC